METSAFVLWLGIHALLPAWKEGEVMIYEVTAFEFELADGKAGRAGRDYTTDIRPHDGPPESFRFWENGPSRKKRDP